jgi:hypothetical protein
MLTELWSNKSIILKNYLGILKYYLPDITIIIILFALIVIYAYIRYKGVKTLHSLQALHELEKHSTINTIEGFANNTTAHHEILPLLFVTPESQKQILQTIHTTYLAHFNQPNIQARGFDTRDEMIRSYNKCLIPITDSEKMDTWRRIYDFVDTLHDVKQREYIHTWLSKIQIAKGATWLESGMPHTHANCIIMRPDWFGASFKGNTFIHELTHVIQRVDPNPWNELYTQWGFIQASELSGLESYLNLNRANPDGMSINWIWQSPNTDKYYWIAAVYKSAAPNSLTAVDYLAVPVNKTSRENTFKYTGATPRQIATLAEFRDYFGIDENHYHPNEIAAQYAEYYFSEDSDKKAAMNKYAGYNIFNMWVIQLI